MSIKLTQHVHLQQGKPADQMEAQACSTDQEVKTCHGEVQRFVTVILAAEWHSQEAQVLLAPGFLRQEAGTGMPIGICTCMHPRKYG